MCSLRNWTFPCIISKEVTDTFLFCLIFLATYASGILRSYADLFLYMPHAHSYHICSSFTVWDSRLWRLFGSLVLLHPRKVICAFFRYVVKPWNFSDRRSTRYLHSFLGLPVSVYYCRQKYFIITLYSVTLFAETGLNQLKLRACAHARTHTHTHTHTTLWGSFEMNGRRLGAAYRHLLNNLP
jgi:hypothetical protein